MLRISVKAIPVLMRERQVLLLRECEYDGGKFPQRWDVPGGTMQPDEKLLDTLSRELYEECGLQLPKRNSDLFDMYVFQDRDTIAQAGGGTLRMYCVLPVWTKPALRLGNDHDMAQWFTLNGLPRKDDMMPHLHTLCVRALTDAKR